MRSAAHRCKCHAFHQGQMRADAHSAPCARADDINAQAAMASAIASCLESIRREVDMPCQYFQPSAFQVRSLLVSLNITIRKHASYTKCRCYGFSKEILATISSLPPPKMTIARHMMMPFSCCSPARHRPYARAQTLSPNRRYCSYHLFSLLIYFSAPRWRISYIFAHFGAALN